MVNRSEVASTGANRSSLKRSFTGGRSEPAGARAAACPRKFSHAVESLACSAFAAASSPAAPSVVFSRSGRSPWFTPSKTACIE